MTNAQKEAEAKKKQIELGEENESMRKNLTS